MRIKLQEDLQCKCEQIIMKYSIKADSIQIESKNNIRYIAFYKQSMIRVYETKNKEDLFEMNYPDTSTDFAVSKINENTINIEFSNNIITVDCDLNISVSRSKTTIFKETNQSDKSLNLHVNLSEDSHVFGLGDKMSSLDRKGYHYASWNTDDSAHQDELFPALYKTSNFLLMYSNNNYYGVYFPSTYRYDFDIAKTDPNDMNITSENAEVDYFLILKTKVNDIVSALSSMCGHPYLVRLKMLGNNQSRWSYETEKDVQDVVDNFEKYEIPLDYIHLDIHYLDSYKILTVDKSRYPDLRGFSSKLKTRGIGLVGINDAAVKVEPTYKLYDELIANDLVSTLDGKPYINTVWPGESVFPNYFNPETQSVFDSYMSKFIEDTGLSGIWNDMNEPASFKGELPLNVDMSFKNRKLSHLEAHNMYGEKMTLSSYNYFTKQKVRPYVFTRSAFATTSKYAFVWNGDNFSLWHHLQYSIPQSLSMGLSNFMFNGDDVGGFGGDCNKQLLIRWTEANILFPFFRNHSSLNTKRQEPYYYDKETISIYKKFLDLRYSLIPYLYTCAHNMASNGVPITTPLFYQYQNDVNTLNINDEYMVGKDILVAPILQKDSTDRIVYLPEGKWMNYFTKEVFDGNKKYIMTFKLGELGLFVKANSIIPMYQNIKHIDKKNIDTLFININGTNCSTDIYEDDGYSLDYKRGIYNIYHVEYASNTLKIQATTQGYNSDYKFIHITGENIDKTVPFSSDIILKI